MNLLDIVTKIKTQLGPFKLFQINNGICLERKKQEGATNICGMFRGCLSIYIREPKTTTATNLGPFNLRINRNRSQEASEPLWYLKIVNLVN